MNILTIYCIVLKNPSQTPCTRCVPKQRVTLMLGGKAECDRMQYSYMCGGDDGSWMHCTLEILECDVRDIFGSAVACVSANIMCTRNDA